MSINDTILIIGGDLRQIYMANILISKGLNVVVYGLDHPTLDVNCKKAKSLKDAINMGDIIIGPIPVTRDKTHIYGKEEKKDLKLSTLSEELHSGQFFIGGNIPASLVQICNEKEILYYDLMKDEQITILNSIATAEGTIFEAIKHSTINLHGSKCLILGYGRCATVLAKKLSGLDVDITICARRPENLASAKSFGYEGILLSHLKEYISDFDYIINTIPSVVLSKELLELLSQETTIIDIASAPGGVDYDYAKENNLNAHLCLGLPGKVAPKTSANILVDAIFKIIKKGSE
ncbi:dipicolinate synthase subunit A [Mobilisporobacter senegalensis]|uniref:Dipicolinate synthase subunit A n=1 Tax=Mobilisporobacter senegalensis TaxID=1329262 RepID=A0A3N1X6C9_9FIRM|nr:dipicolinate synthase subunit DpsA [Mobilisporobacter senegalensis]ROR22336.1 dipicolinate synthase subunit A [Mobilisporobacter senegalensis]